MREKGDVSVMMLYHRNLYGPESGRTSSLITTFFFAFPIPHIRLKLFHGPSHQCQTSINNLENRETPPGEIRILGCCRATKSLVYLIEGKISRYGKQLI